LPLFACGTAVQPEEAEQAGAVEAAATPTKASVGKSLFFDTNLSNPVGLACATCHDPAHGYADGRSGPTSAGAPTGMFGPRNTPGIIYARYIGPLTTAADEAGYAGGMFWDGRAPDLETQAGGPLLNPIEMGNASKAAVVAKVKASSYASQFKKVFGSSAFSNTDTAFTYITQAIAEFERTGITGRFTSKYDAYLAGTTTLTDSEQRGLAIFEDKTKGNCASCHLDKPAADGSPPLFTDFGYDNLGIPKNPANKYYTLPSSVNPLGADYVDYGLSAPIHNPRQAGKFKAPTLRNIALTAPYGHNGYFADLQSIVHFYNTRDVGTWDAPEVSFGMNTVDMGNLKLSAQDEADLVAFMQTLTDGF
jgi:cytochrome c peroxidase